MNEFGGMLMERVVTESTPARKSSHALACGTRAFIISHLARAALIDALSRRATFTISVGESLSAAAVRIGAFISPIAASVEKYFIGRKTKKIPVDVCLRSFCAERGYADTWLGLSRMFQNRVGNRARSSRP